LRPWGRLAAWEAGNGTHFQLFPQANPAATWSRRV